MKHFSLAIVSFFVLVHAFSSQAAIIEGLVVPFMRHLTLPKVIQGGINNSLLGLFYYQFFYKTEQKNKVDVEQFVKNTKPWKDAPECLREYNPRIFTAGDSPTDLTFSYALLPGRPFYVIDGKVFVNHKVKFDYARDELSAEELYRAVRFEYERQQTFPAFQSESNKSFFEGIFKFIVAKKVGSKILYPTFRPFFEQEGFYFFWTYPRIVFWSVVDLCTKFIYGRYNFVNKKNQKYIESYNEILDRWKEAAAKNATRDTD